MRCYEVLWGVYEQPAITAITPVMAAPITLSGDKSLGCFYAFDRVRGECDFYHFGRLGAPNF